METFLWLVGILSYSIFFGTDFYLAFLLERLKKAHPAIVEATPSAGEEYKEAEDQRHTAAVDVGDSDDEREGMIRRDYQQVNAARPGHGSTGSGSDGERLQHRAPYRGYPSSDDETHMSSSRMHGSTGAGLDGGGSTTQSTSSFWATIHLDPRTMTIREMWLQIRQHPYLRAVGFGRKDNALLLQNLVLFLSAFAPFLVFLQVVAPGSMSWSRFKMPAWLGYLTLVPGLGVVAFYAMRTYRVHLQLEVSKSQWMSMMWFRLDVICVMAAIMLLGWGDWLVAGCLFIIDLYLAQRLLTTERKLVNTQGAEWLRREGRSGVVGVEDDEERFNQPARALVEIAQAPLRAEQ